MVPEEGRDIVVKGVTNNCVHDVEEDYRKLSSIGTMKEGALGGIVGVVGCKSQCCSSVKSR